jgi:hypothetical protein
MLQDGRREERCPALPTRLNEHLVYLRRIPVVLVQQIARLTAESDQRPVVFCRELPILRSHPQIRLIVLVAAGRRFVRAMTATTNEYPNQKHPRDGSHIEDVIGG